MPKCANSSFTGLSESEADGGASCPWSPREAELVLAAFVEGTRHVATDPDTAADLVDTVLIPSLTRHNAGVAGIDGR